jgi:hypothetical protein
VSPRVFLIYFFKLLIEALSKNAISQRTLSKVFAEILEEAKTDNLGKKQKNPRSRLRKYLLDHDTVSQAIEETSPVILNSKSIPPTFYHGISIALDTLSHYNDRENSAKEVDVSPKEGELQQGVETTNLQALKEFGDSVEEKLKSSEETSDVFNKAVSLAVSLAPDIHKASQKGVALEEIKEVLQRKAQALPKKGDIFSPRPKQEKAVQPPDLSKIPLWQGRKRGEMPLDYLKTHYGQYLSVFGAEQNSVFQDQIRAHDPKLVQGVINQLREEGKGRKVGGFVKTRSARVDRELENIDPEHLREAHRLKSADRRRRRKKADTKASSY